MSGVQLAKEIGKSQPYFSRRINGTVSFDLDDLEAIAKVLEVDVTDLLPNREGRVNRDFDQAPAERPVTVGQGFVAPSGRVTRPPKPKASPRPNGRPKPGTTHPPSTVPPRQRRPAPVGR